MRMKLTFVHSRQPAVMKQKVAKLSIIHAYVAEQVRHRLSVVNATDCLGQDHADVDRLNFGTLQFLDLMWNGVCDNHLQGVRKANQFENTDY